MGKKLSITVIAVFMMLSQSGCVVGLAFWYVPPIVAPCVVIGSLMVGAGIPLTVVGTLNMDTPSILGTGVGLLLAGTILDEGNLGRDDSMNPIPRDRKIAEALGVEIADIENYNDHLNEIREVALELQKDIRSQTQRTDLAQYSGYDALAHDPQIEQLAKKYGLENGEDFANTLKHKSLPKEKLEAFAKATQLDPQEAKILLHYGFAINTL